MFIADLLINETNLRKIHSTMQIENKLYQDNGIVFTANK